MYIIYAGCVDNAVVAVFCLQVLDKHKSDSLTNLMEKLDECLVDGIVILMLIARAKIIWH